MTPRLKENSTLAEIPMRECLLYRTALGAFALLALGMLALGVRSAWAGEALVPVARVGPWPAVSGLIGYAGRLWFVNSAKFADHNSADIHGYDPKTGRVQYERHLFSQDGGRPAAVEGLLFWPFEDARFSTGRGEFVVTNGHDWQWREMPSGQVFHVHAMLAHGGALYAATGGFRAGLQRSEDRGRSWIPVYEHRNAPGSFSRLVSLGSLASALYAGLFASDEPGVKLLRLRKGKFVPVPGWPSGESADSLTGYRGWLYAVHRTAHTSQVWRTDGRKSHRVRALAKVPVRALASGGGMLWAVSARGSGGMLWQSRDGIRWRITQRFDGDEPIDVAVYGGRPYVGMIGTDGRGALYGPAPPAPVEPAPLPTTMPEDSSQETEGDLPALLAPLDRALADLAAFEAGGGALRDLLDPIIRLQSPAAGEALSERLGRAADSGLSRFAGRMVPAAEKADWLLLWAIARTGHGRVPPALLTLPWRAQAHPGEKYVEAPPGAAWAVSALRQDDAPTLTALIERLDRAGDPPWLTGDLVGALTALTGCRFGYDVVKWRAWWANRQDCRAAPGPAEAAAPSDVVLIPGGRFVMGDAAGEPDEAPREVTVRAFRLMRLEVTNREFAEFVAATDHVTDPERSGFGYVWTDRWRPVAKADWRHPQGPGSTIAGLNDHPVVQVSARDAAAFCAWRGLRLPTEQEWEFAARGTDGRRYPWGDEPPRQRGSRRANFGSEKCCAADASDGFLRTAPVGSFRRGASFFGVLDMAGNVWEWTASPYSADSGEVALRGGGWGNDPYCLRVSYRHGNPPDIGLDMVGIRCAGD